MGRRFLGSFRLIPYNFTGGPDMLRADASEVTDIDKDIDAWERVGGNASSGCEVRDLRGGRCDACVEVLCAVLGAGEGAVRRGRSL
jgi:hypothetical protein